MSVTDNLLLAFEEEAKNRERYLAFAEQADAEGKHQIARLFRAAAESELIHAVAELRALGEVKSTAENVQYAIDAEEREFQDVYAGFLREARREGNEETAVLWERILKVERGHYDLFNDALAALTGGEDFATGPAFVCRTCGNTVVGDLPPICPICSAPAEAFVEVN